MFALLLEDAKILRNVGTNSQLEALGKRSRRKAAWQQGEPDAVGPNFGAAWGGTPEEAAIAAAEKRYREAQRKRLWGE